MRMIPIAVVLAMSSTALLAQQNARPGAAKERDFQLVVAGAQKLKDSMKKPEAFKLISAVMTDEPAICYEYQGRNSFNDQRREVMVVTKTTSSGSAKAWNKHCAGKTGTDFSYARQALR